MKKIFVTGLWLSSAFVMGCSTMPSKSAERGVAAEPAAAVILDYSSGFQAGWSWLKIYSDGTVEHQERVCCPPKTSEVPHSALSASDINELKSLITAAQNGKLAVTKNITLGLGEKIGSLYVYTDAGDKVTIEDVVRATTGSGSTTINSSSATRQIVDFIKPYVKNVILDQ